MLAGKHLSPIAAQAWARGLFLIQPGTARL